MVSALMSALLTSSGSSISAFRKRFTIDQIKLLGLIFKDKIPPCEEDDFLIKCASMNSECTVKALMDINTVAHICFFMLKYRMPEYSDAD